MQKLQYDREKALAYAKKWAFSRNPKYYNFDRYALGGNCTNFISQCLYAGGAVMNYAKYGWFYVNLNSRSPAWTGVQQLFSFLTSNKAAGPFGSLIEPEEASVADVMQFSFDGKVFSHSSLITAINDISPEGILLATNTFDSYDRPLSTYAYKLFRIIHIDGIRP